MGMKRFLFLQLTAVLLVLTGCRGAGEKLTLNECGIELPIANKYLDNGITYQAIDSGAVILFSYKPELEKLYQEAEIVREEKWESMSEEEQYSYAQEFSDRARIHEKILAYFIVLSDEEYQFYKEGGFEKTNFLEKMTIFANKNKRTYLYMFEENTSEGMSEEEARLFKECESHVQKAAKKAKALSLPKSVSEDTSRPSDSASQPQSSIGDVPDFSTTDLDGNKIDSSIFSGKALTVINIWGTFCPPCIKEMPELGEWAETLPKDVQLIGIVSDISSASDTDSIAEAKEILSSANAGFVNLIAGGELGDYLSAIQFVPTTLFVDSQGHLVDEPVTGAKVSEYKKTVERFLATAAR